MKIIEIKNCRDCPYLKQYMECGKTRMTVNEFPLIPHWCPLKEGVNILKEQENEKHT